MSFILHTDHVGTPEAVGSMPIANPTDKAIVWLFVSGCNRYTYVLVLWFEIRNWLLRWRIGPTAALRCSPYTSLIGDIGVSLHIKFRTCPGKLSATYAVRSQGRVTSSPPAPRQRITRLSADSSSNKSRPQGCLHCTQTPFSYQTNKTN